MKRTNSKLKSKAGCVAARLTGMEQKQVLERAEASGLTVSEWVRQTLLETLYTSPQELRLMTFIAAEGAALRLAMEEWQQGRHLTEPDVRERIERLSIAAGLERSRATVSRLDVARREDGEAA